MPTSIFIINIYNKYLQTLTDISIKHLLRKILSWENRKTRRLLYKILQTTVLINLPCVSKKLTQ